MDGEMDIDDLTRAIEKICTVSGADIWAALYALWTSRTKAGQRQISEFPH
jgi:hypothetical protein